MVISLSTSLRQNTYFHEKLLGDADSPPQLVVRENSLPSKELETLHTMSRLTRVVLDERVLAQGAIPDATPVARVDQREVSAARRTLYE